MINPLFSKAIQAATDQFAPLTVFSLDDLVILTLMRLDITPQEYIRTAREVREYIRTMLMV